MTDTERKLIVPTTVDEWLSLWKATTNLDGLLGLLHGLFRIRPQVAGGAKFSTLLGLLVDHAMRIVSTYSSSETESLGPWQEVHKLAGERLIFWFMGRRIVPASPEFLLCHTHLLGFLTRGPIGIFSGQAHIKAVSWYLESLVEYQEGDTTGDMVSSTTLSEGILQDVVRAGCAWGLASIFMSRQKRPCYSSETVLPEMKKFLANFNYDPQCSLEPNLYRGLYDIPHHIHGGELGQFGKYRTGLVVLMLEQELKKATA